MIDETKQYKARIITLLKNGQLTEAQNLCTQLCSRNRSDSDAWLMLANINGQQNNYPAAEHCYRQLININPDIPIAHYNLGCLLQLRGDECGALACFRQAIHLQPDYKEARFNLGGLLQQRGELSASEHEYRRVLELDPKNHQTHFNIGLIAQSREQFEEAESRFRATLALRPDMAEAHANLGAVLQQIGKLQDAIKSLKAALKLDPKSVQAYYNLGTTFLFCGDINNAIDAYRKAVEFCPDFSKAYSNLLFCLNYSESYQDKEIYEEHRKWARRYAEPVDRILPDYHHIPHKDRQLNIGYLSPDFRHHPVGYFIEPILAAHDRSTVKVHCYSNSKRLDDLSEQIKQHSVVWRDIHAMDDDMVANLIRSDKIDILVDLAGHTDNNRALVFARKPAAIQVSYLGYLNTSGMTAMDFHFTDQWMDPPGENSELYTEMLVALPYGQLCFVPPPHCPDVSNLPADSSGHITFGCFNNSSKISTRTLSVWSKILKELPHSSITLKSRQLGDPFEAQRMIARFETYGVPGSRIDILGQSGMDEYMACYNCIDIALDPFPYNGGTITWHALWMGVPVITLAGRTGFSRTGASILSSLGLPQFIAFSEKEYIQKAVALAKDFKNLKDMRHHLRGKMQRKPAMDSVIFTRSIENAYSDMVRNYRGQ